jgi:hypothetical protein
VKFIWLHYGEEGEEETRRSGIKKNMKKKSDSGTKISNDD